MHRRPAAASEMLDDLSKVTVGSPELGGTIPLHWLMK